MPPAPLTSNEAERVAALEASGLLDIAADSQLDDLAKLAATVTGMPVVLVSLVKRHEQMFLSRIGFDCAGTPRDAAFCSHTILSTEPMVVEDASLDPRFVDNPLVTGPTGVRFYAGVPIFGASGHPFGSLCVIDTQPRKISESALEALRVIGRMVEMRLQLLQRAKDADRRADQYRDLASELTAMRVKSDRLAAIARHTINAVIITDADERIEWVNDAFTQMTGYTFAEVLGRRPGDFLQGPDTNPETVAEMTRRIAERRPVDVEILNYRKDGTPYWLQVQIQPLQDETGRLTGFMAIELDITERKQQAKELERARDAAESASRAKSAFLANMSHEIRTPLTAILGYTDVLLEDPSADAPDLLRAVKRNGEHLLTILSDVLDLSKMEVGHLHMDPSPCDPLSVLRDAAELLGPQARGNGLTFRVELPETPEPVMVMTDAGRLRQIIVNLVSNAVKFTQAGSITVRGETSRTPNGQVRLRCSVSDTGPGVDPRFLSRIFEPFEQGDPSMSRRTGGTGLGLAISQRLARQLGGEIRVESELGHGSTFTLDLDLAPASASEPRRPRPPESRRTEPPMVGRVLLVEDSPDSRRLIETLLKGAGLCVSVAQNGQAALEAVDAARDSNQTFDLILMDMQMPILDGYDATRRLRAEGYSRPIVAVTAHALAGDREACLEAGCSDYATKPIRKDPFLRLVRHWLHRPHTGPDNASSRIGQEANPETRRAA